MTQTILIIIVFVAFVIAAPRVRRYMRVLKFRKQQNINEENTNFCVLCSKHKNDVDNMVAGERGAICSGCLVGSLELLDKQGESVDGRLSYFDSLVINRVDEKSFLDDSISHLVEYILKKCEESKSNRKKILAEFLTKRNFICAKKIIDSIPREEWGPSEVINWIWANSMVGDFQGALEYPASVKSDDPLRNGAYQRALKVSVISVHLEMSSDENSIVSYLAELDEIKQFFDENEYPIATDVTNLMPHILSSIANCHYLLGDYGKALEYLSQRENLVPHNEFCLLLMGNIYEGNGDQIRANEYWRLGLKLCARGIYTQRLQEKLKIVN